MIDLLTIENLEKLITDLDHDIHEKSEMVKNRKIKQVDQLLSIERNVVKQLKSIDNNVV